MWDKHFRRTDFASRGCSYTSSVNTCTTYLYEIKNVSTIKYCYKILPSGLLLIYREVKIILKDAPTNLKCKKMQWGKDLKQLPWYWMPQRSSLCSFRQKTIQRTNCCTGNITNSIHFVLCSAIRKLKMLQQRQWVNYCMKYNMELSRNVQNRGGFVGTQRQNKY